MTTHKEALTLALEMVQNKMYAHAEMYLKEALAQEQEPMPCNICGKQMNTGRVEDMDCGGDCCACMAMIGDPDCEALLSKHKQEPVAHTAVFHCPNCEYPHRQVTHITGVAQPPWLPQRTWVGLTEDEAVSAVSSVLPVTSTGGQTHYLQIQHKHALEITRAIEAKLKEKNT
jgi:hypothetical protein